eukprot:1394759-Amorphochlora_amoeboformis.AAC.4
MTGYMVTLVPLKEILEMYAVVMLSREVRSVVEWDMDAGCVDGPHEDGIPNKTSQRRCYP